MTTEELFIYFLVFILGSMTGIFFFFRLAVYIAKESIAIKSVNDIIIKKSIELVSSNYDERKLKELIATVKFTQKFRYRLWKQLQSIEKEMR